MTNAIIPRSCAFSLYNHSQNESDLNLVSRQEIAFLLESGACSLKITIPTYMMITQKISVCNQTQHDISET